jgi:cell division protein DivIC
MNISKINKAMNLIVILLVIYVIFTTIKQQTKINSYEKDIAYYTSQKESLIEKKADLEATQKNVNSEEYIEEVAREKLDMYYPNETVYIDISK